MPDGHDLVYGLHAWRACIFAFSLSKRRIVKQYPELGMGDHCHNALIFGPDDRKWGPTNDCVFSIDRDLGDVTVVAPYEDCADRNAYRFGMTRGPDGHVYFPNGTHLMRVRIDA